MILGTFGCRSHGMEDQALSMFGVLNICFTAVEPYWSFTKIRGPSRDSKWQGSLQEHPQKGPTPNLQKHPHFKSFNGHDPRGTQISSLPAAAKVFEHVLSLVAFGPRSKC